MEIDLMFAVTVLLKTRPKNANTVLAMARSNAAVSLSEEPGCRQFDTCWNSNRQEFIFLYELYDDYAAFEDHLRTEHFKAFDANVAGLLLSKEVHTYPEVYT